MLKNAAALAFAAALGASGAISTVGLLREAPGAKTYYAHGLDLRQAPLPDGGNTITAVAYVTATLVQSDGGVSAVDLGGDVCPLPPVRLNAAQNLLDYVKVCGQ